MARSENGAKHAVGYPALWPWSVKAAILLVPAIMATFLMVLLIARGAARWPDSDYDGWILLAIVLFSILPLALLLIQAVVAAGGRVQVAGVTVSFAGASEDAARDLRTTTIAENLGTADDDATAVSTDSLRSIMRALRTAHTSEVTVVDLGRGQSWWDSRLFLLVAGAARRGRPQAIAFVGDENGTSGVFLGWAPPDRLLAMHLAGSVDLATKHANAAAQADQWALGTKNPSVPSRANLPWSASLELPSLNSGRPDPAFAFEMFLQQQVDGIQDTREYVTPDWLARKYRPDLIRDHVDVAADDAQWAEVLTADARPFVALTSAGRLKTLVRRDTLVATLVAQLIKEGRRTAQT